MKALPIYSIVAYSGTGKTTLLEQLIPEMKRRGFRICVLKHDAHEFEIDYPGKDSWRITRAGADITIISSAAKAVVMENRPVSTSDLLAMIKDVDIIITEGYTHGDWKKIGLLRASSGKPLAVPPETCCAIVTDVRLDTCTPCFSFGDICGLADFLEADVYAMDIEEEHRCERT